jgi:hypothetical protein
VRTTQYDRGAFSGARRTEFRRRFLRSFGGSAAALAAVFAALAGPGASAPAHIPAAPAASSFDQPADVVIAVDESGSITTAEMAQEREAADQIAIDDFAPGSHVEVIGFGGVDSAASSSNPETPFDLVCQMQEIGTGTGLASCIADLRIRQLGQGYNTDFGAALGQAVGDLQNTDPGSGVAKDVFMLTDGMLDVDGSNNADSPANQAAQKALFSSNPQASPLAQAAQDGVDVWTLGFGADADMDELNQISAQGAQTACSSLPAAHPHAIHIASTADLPNQLADLFAGARCGVLGVSTPPSASIVGPGTQDLTVQIPDIAAVAVIHAVRINPSIQVQFIAPNGATAPPSGTIDASTYQLENANGSDVALQITNPIPGAWTVQYTAPSGVDAQLSANVFWTGSISAYLDVSSPRPLPGTTVTTAVQIDVRNSLPANAADLTNLTVQLTLTGDGFSPVGPIALSPDPSTGGLFSGTITIPRSATGRLAFTTVINGPGLVTDTQVESGKVQSPGDYVNVQLSFTRSSAPPGGSVPVQLEVDNESGTAHTLVVQLSDQPAGLAVSPATVTVPAASGLSTEQLTLHFGSAMARGRPSGRILIQDSADGSTLADSPIYASVVPPLSLIAQYRWELMVLTAAVAAGILVYLNAMRSRRRHADLSGVEFQLWDRGMPASSLIAPERTGTRFAFEIERSSAAGARLNPAQRGTGYRARRGPAGGLDIAPPDDGVLVHVPGVGSLTDIGDGLRIGYHDPRLDENTSDERFDYTDTGSPDGFDYPEPDPTVYGEDHVDDGSGATAGPEPRRRRPGPRLGFRRGGSATPTELLPDPDPAPNEPPDEPV